MEENVKIENEVNETEEAVTSKEEPFVLEDFVVTEEAKEKEDVITPATETTLEQAKKEPTKSMPTFNSLAIGVFSNEVKHNKQLSSVVSSVNQKMIEQFLAYKENKTVLWAKVSDVEYNVDPEGNRTMVGIVCNWNNGIKVVIPDALYFMDNTLFGKGYEEKSKEEQINTRHRIATFQIGAIVCFTVYSANESEYGGLSIIGNRVEAMQELQDFYFTHEKYKKTDENTLVIGAIAQANVLSVKSHDVLVECCGVETHIDSFSIANFPVENCREVVSVGDRMSVRIRKVHYEPKPYLTVTGRIANVKVLVANTNVGTTTLAKLIERNEKAGNYTFRMDNGVNVVVSKGFIRIVNPERLVRGDKVVLQITKKSKDGTFLFGKVLQKV